MSRSLLSSIVDRIDDRSGQGGHLKRSVAASLCQYQWEDLKFLMVKFMMQATCQGQQKAQGEVIAYPSIQQLGMLHSKIRPTSPISFSGLLVTCCSPPILFIPLTFSCLQACLLSTLVINSIRLGCIQVLYLECDHLSMICWPETSSQVRKLVYRSVLSCSCGIDSKRTKTSALTGHQLFRCHYKSRAS